MDNLSSHKSPAVRAPIEAAGAELRFLPPYSPDFNPIEKAFAKLKALLRKAAERTVDGLWRAIGPFVDAFTPAECANYFSACGYDPDWSDSALVRNAGARRPIKGDIEMPYTLNKNGVTPSGTLTKVEQDHLNEFMNRIRNEGISPKEAASGWDSKYTKLVGDQYEIRLSQSNRATFTVVGTTVTMLQVGGHT